MRFLITFEGEGKKTSMATQGSNLLRAVDHLLNTIDQDVTWAESMKVEKIHHGRRAKGHLSFPG